MSQISMTSGGSDPAQNAPTQDATTHLSADLGEIMSSSSLMKSEHVPRAHVNQRMPRNDLTDYLTRYAEIAQFTFTDVTPGKGQAVVVAPWQQFLLNSYIAAKTSNYFLIRGTLEVMVVPAFPANGYGAYTVTAYPIGNPNNSTATVQPNFTTCMQTDHFTYLDVAACENTTMQLPFLWPYDYASISTLTTGTNGGAEDAMWALRIWCLSPVKTSIPGGVTSGSIRVYARLLPDYELVVPSLQGKRKQSMVGSKRMEGMTGAADMVAGGKYKGVVSGLADKVSGVTSMLSTLPVIGPYAGVATKIADTVGDVASWFGFTREDAEKVPVPMTQRPFSNPAHIDGDDTSESATLSMANSISIDPLINGVSPSEDQMSFPSLFSRWTLVKEMTWTPDQTTSTILGSIPVSPFYGEGVTSATTAQIYLTTAGYCGLPFKYWRGDMEYKVVIPVSKLHRGTLQVYWVPSGATSTATPTVSALNVIYDVAADEEKQISVGYAQDRPYLYSIILPQDVPILPTDYLNGRLLFMVVNPLQSQNAATGVDILVFARAKSNMDFQVLTDVVEFYTTGGVATAFIQNNSFTYQGATGDEDEEEDTVVSLVPDTGSYPAPEINFGENVSSARAMMQKFSWIARTPDTNNNFYHMPYQYANTGAHVMVYDSHYAYLFHGVASSMRWKVLPTSLTAMFSAHLQSPNRRGVHTQGNDNLFPTQIPVSGGGEIRIPYYSPMKYGLMRTSDPNSLQDYVSVIDSAGAEVTKRTCRAAGSDIRITCFASVPLVTLTDGSTPTSPWV